MADNAILANCNYILNPKIKVVDGVFVDQKTNRLIHNYKFKLNGSNEIFSMLSNDILKRADCIVCGTFRIKGTLTNGERIYIFIDSSLEYTKIIDENIRRLLSKMQYFILKSPEKRYLETYLELTNFNIFIKIKKPLISRR